VKAFFAAVQFLTIVPVPSRWSGDEEDLGDSVPFFVIVGVLAGLAAAVFARAVCPVVPPLVAGVLLVIFLVSISGGLHMDGLSDTADGFLSSRDREGILEIMKDSRAGPMGVMAVVCALLLKAASLGTMSPDNAWRMAFLMPLAGRCALPITIAMLPYVRPGGGLGTVFCKERPVPSAVIAALVLIFAGSLVAGGAGLCGVITSLIATLLFVAYCYRKIQGATGDTFGAACELGEVACAVAMAAWIYTA